MLKNNRIKRAFAIIGTGIIVAVVLTVSSLQVSVRTDNGFVSFGISTAQAAPAPKWTQGYEVPAVNQTANNNYDVKMSGETIHIGGATNKFDPNLHIGRFGAESYIDLNLVGGGSLTNFNSSSYNTTSNTITAENNYFILKYTPIALKPPYNEMGGLDYVLIVKQNLGSNSITFTYNHQKANAYLQPPLTQAEIDAGATRPDYVVNSIAFYGDSNQVNNSYKTGKIGHLYRMRVTDNVGNQTWADWGFGGGQSQITLTVNQTWLNNAVYPITIAPVGDTFGYTSEGITNEGVGANVLVTTGILTYSPSLDGNTVSISALVYDSGGGHAKYGLFNSLDESLIGNTDATGVLDGSAAWASSTVSVNCYTTINYRLAFKGENSGFGIRFDSGDPGTAELYQSNLYSASFPNPASWSTFGSTQRIYSIYVTYTPSGGGAALTNSPSSKAFGVLTAGQSYWSNGSAPTFGSATNITYNATTGSANWTNPSFAYADNGGQAANMTSGSPSATSTFSGYGATAVTSVTSVRIIADAYSKGFTTTANNTNNPTANNGTAWANPTGAYQPDGTNVTSIISGSPSGTNIWKTFGFGSVTPSSVRVLVDALSTNTSTVTTANKSPVAVSANTGAFTTVGGTAPAVMADTANTTYVIGVTNGGGHLTFTFTPFAVPVGSTNIALHVVFLHRSDTSTNANLGAAAITVGTNVTYGTGVQPNANSGAIKLTQQDWATNPNTGAAWTVAQINGASVANNLTAFGVGSTDFNPDCDFYEVKAWVTYDCGDQEDLFVEVSKDAGVTWNTTTFNLTATNATYTWNITEMSWNATTIQNGNPCIRMSAITVGETGNVTVSWIRLEVLSGGTGADNEQLYLEITNNGGSSWNATTITLNGTETRYYWDVTTGITWNITTLNNTNLQVRASAITVGDTGNVSLDWLAVEVVTAADVLDDAECYFTINNTGSVSINISVSSTNFTSSGTGWGLSTSTGNNTARMSVLKSGDTATTSNITLNATSQGWITNLANGGIIKWELRLDSPTFFIDGFQNTATITLTAVGA